METIFVQIFESVGSYIPQLIGALVILIVGWLIALIISNLVRSLLKRTDLDNKLVSWVTGEKAPNVEQGVGRVVFWLIMILVLIAFEILDLISSLSKVFPVKTSYGVRPFSEQCGRR